MTNKIINICLYCSNEFQTLKTEIKRGKGKFCSRACANKFNPKKSISLKNLLYKNISSLSNESGCWLYTKLIMKGYGHINIGGKKIPAHRISYEIHHGKIPESMYVCHKCDVRACINPDHLFIGNHLDNMLDKVLKGRAAVKLNFEQVVQIKNLINAGVSDLNISKKYCVNRQTINKIRLNKLWKHVTSAL